MGAESTVTPALEIRNCQWKLGIGNWELVDWLPAVLRLIDRRLIETQ